MLRYIYLLCFIIIINFELVFCYNYISENHRRFRPDRQRRRAVRIAKRQASFDERPLQQIDVANFILSPDEAEGYRLEPDEFYNKRSYEAPESRSLRGRRREAPYPGEPSDAGAGGLSRYQQQQLSRYQQQQLSRRHLLHKPMKKCALTKIFPFFSHNKSDTAQPKKGARNKICFGACSKKAKEHDAAPAESATLDLHKEQKSQKDRSGEARIDKRYAEQICPKCKMKFSKLKKKRTQPKVIHNSRQYFAINPVIDNAETSSKQFKNVNFRKRFDKDELSEVRRKKRRER